MITSVHLSESTLLADVKSKAYHLFYSDKSKFATARQSGIYAKWCASSVLTSSCFKVIIEVTIISSNIIDPKNKEKCSIHSGNVNSSCRNEKSSTISAALERRQTY